MLQRWLSVRAVLFHLLLATIVPACMIAGWWQMHRALGGNTLSWAYTFEWPIFAVIAFVGWWQMIHEDPADLEARREERRRRAKEVGPPTVDPLPVALRQASTGGGAWAGGTVSVNGTISANGTVSVDEAPTDALDAYNAYLASLATNGKAKTWRNPQGRP